MNEKVEKRTRKKEMGNSFMTVLPHTTLQDQFVTIYKRRGRGIHKIKTEREREKERERGSRVIGFVC